MAERDSIDPPPQAPKGVPFGLNFAGTALLGVEPADDGRSCLVELSPETFAATRRACVLPFDGSGPYTISPDGRVLLLNLTFGTPDGLWVRIDLSTAFSTPTPAEEFLKLGDIGLSGLTWIDSTTVVVAWKGGVRTININNPDVIVEIPLAELPHDEFGPNPAWVQLVG